MSFPLSYEKSFRVTRTLTHKIASSKDQKNKVLACVHLQTLDCQKYIY